jgi:hypothetical protein
MTLFYDDGITVKPGPGGVKAPVVKIVLGTVGNILGFTANVLGVVES